MPSALITGITGQDGSYLAELLLEKGYDVHGMVRRASTEKFDRIEHLRDRITLHQGDLLDQRSLVDTLRAAAPDEVYNLAAMSFVALSVGPADADRRVHRRGRDADARGVREACPETRFYQASRARRCSARCARRRRPRRRPSTRARRTAWPRSTATTSRSTTASPTTCFAASGILFNHESERRGLEFVTRKITWHAAAIKLGRLDKLQLGNLDARRDWGYAKDYVEAMWLMLQHDTPDDFVIATGETNTVRRCVEIAFDEAGLPTGSRTSPDRRFLKRPAEVDLLVGDATKAERELGWKPKTTLRGADPPDGPLRPGAAVAMKVGIVGLGYVGLPLVGRLRRGRLRRDRAGRRPGQGRRAARGPLAHRGHPGRAARRRARALHVDDPLRRAARGRRDPGLRPDAADAQPRAGPRAAAVGLAVAGGRDPARADDHPRVHDLPGHHARAPRAAAGGVGPAGRARTSRWPSRPSASTRAGRTTRCATRRRSSAGCTDACTEAAVAVYAPVCDEIVRVSTPEVAELSKLLENIFRSVNIALVNEMAMLADRMGIDIWEVVEAASTKPYGFMPFQPGPGMGGHCLPVDPFYLTWKAREYDLSTEFIELAGKVNQQMPYFCLEKAERALNDARKPVHGLADPDRRRLLQGRRRRHARVTGAEDHPPAARARRGRLLPRPPRPRARRLRPAPQRAAGRRGRGPGDHRHRPPDGRSPARDGARPAAPWTCAASRGHLGTDAMQL